MGHKTRVQLVEEEIKRTIAKIDKMEFLRSSVLVKYQDETDKKLADDLITATYHYEEKLHGDLDRLRKIESKEKGLV